MIKIGVLGAGNLGKIYLKLLKDIPEFELLGFFDYHTKIVDETVKELGVKAYLSSEQLMEDVDAVVIVTPTKSHYQFAVDALKKSKHVFIEKPITYTLEEAYKLNALANEARVIVQIGHVERFNPAFVAAKKFIINPMLIEATRTSKYNPRGAELSLVLDLMIHDIDIILSIVKSNIKKISASGVSVVGESLDIANARIEFDNGCVANLTANRISNECVRKASFYQRDSYVTIDYLNKQTEIARNKNTINTALSTIPLALEFEKEDILEINFEKPTIKPINALKQELLEFYTSITKNTPPSISIEDGYHALDVAYRIIDKMKYTSSDF